MIWNPGDGSDLIDGGEGTDTMEFNGGAGDEAMLLGPLTDGVVQLDAQPRQHHHDAAGHGACGHQRRRGDDTFEATGNLAAQIALTVDGGAGNDRILGSNGADVLLGGDGNDFIDGQQGADVAFLGAGDDVFQWDPGDGSDMVEGQDGNDTMLFNGAERRRELRDLRRMAAARCSRATWPTSPWTSTTSSAVDVLTLGGVDNFVVNDLTATDVREVAVNLAEASAAADTVTLQGRDTGTEFGFRNSGATLVARGSARKCRCSMPAPRIS